MTGSERDAGVDLFTPGAAAGGARRLEGPPPAAAGDDLVDSIGRPFHPLIHEVNGDGTPARTKDGKHLRRKRGAQGRDGEAAYARLSDDEKRRGVVPGRPAREPAARDPGPARGRDPVEPARAPDPGGDPRGPEPGPVVDDAPDPITPEPYIPGVDDPPGPGDAGDGAKQRDWLGLILLLTTFGLVAWWGPRWAARREQERAMGISDGGEWGRAPAVMAWLREKLSDPEARKTAIEKITHLRELIRSKRQAKEEREAAGPQPTKL